MSLNIVDLIGNTPLVKLGRVTKGNIFVKLEYLNPSGSHKDRIALYMIKDATKRYGLKEGDVIIEASSGNTAISVAWLSKLMKLRAIIVVEEDISPHKLNLIKTLGAQVIKTRKAPPTHPDNLINVAQKVAEKEGGVFLKQHDNEANVLAHYETTAKELFYQLKGNIDVFVMGIGTGGTVAGVGKYLKEKIGTKVRVVGIVPKGSPIIAGEGSVGEPIEGLATSTIPGIYERYRNYIDEIVEVSFKDAFKTMIKVSQQEGILGGLTTGANIHVASELANELGKDYIIATLAPDPIFRYTHLL